MNLQEFERAVLKLAFETEARITTATVAYYLGVPSREANELLNQLLTDGLLELDSDDSELPSEESEEPSSEEEV